MGAWILLSLRPSDNSDQVIIEQWVQIYYDLDSPGVDGGVTIVAFLDYDSADCRDAAVALSKLREADKRVRLVFKEVPTSALGLDFAARAVLATDKQNMFLPLHKELSQGPQPTESSVMTAAKMVGLDTERLGADMNNPAIMAALKRN